MSERPENFRINYGHQLAGGLAFAGLGAFPSSTLYQDSSLYGNHGTSNGFTDTYWDANLNRFAVQQKGLTSGNVLLAGRPPLNTTSCTLCGWIRMAGSWATGYIIDCRADASGNGVYLGSSGNRPYYIYGSKTVAWSGTSATSPNQLTDNQWAHECLVIKGSELTLYENGVAVAVAEKAGNIGVSSALVSGLNAYKDIRVADPLIYNRALSPAEIQQLADPSNVMLSGLILPPRRRVFAAAVGGGETPTFKPAWAFRRQRAIGAGVM